MSMAALIVANMVAQCNNQDVYRPGLFPPLYKEDPMMIHPPVDIPRFRSAPRPLTVADRGRMSRDLNRWNCAK